MTACLHGAALQFGTHGVFQFVVSQVASRAVTFLLNLIVTRLLSPEVYGVRCMLALAA